MAKILIVDDSPSYRLQLSQLVQRLGHSVEVAADGEEGVQKAQADHPDLVLMDLVMPVMDGFAATALIREKSGSARIPVIAVSASANTTPP